MAMVEVNEIWLYGVMVFEMTLLLFEAWQCGHLILITLWLLPTKEISKRNLLFLEHFSGHAVSFQINFDSLKYSNVSNE